MRRDILEIDSRYESSPRELSLHLQDVESMRLVLTGDSVIDWQRLAFRHLDDVDGFLATHCIVATDPEDRERLRFVYNEAVSYLEELLRLRFPKELRDPADVREVFVYASQWGGFRRTQILSCVILKLMHVIHHMEAADLKFRLPVGEAQYLEMAHRRILQAAQELQHGGAPFVSFYGSRKSRSSMITKLLTKREEVASTIFDKLRYRVVVPHHRDIPTALGWLTREIIPFNYIVPGESHNNLFDPSGLVELLPESERERAQEVPVDFSRVFTKNEFSGASYQAINWICDYPVRIPNSVENPYSMELGRVVYVNVEFQLLDEATARANEEGENAHHIYKARQYRRVAARLKRGAAGLDEA